MSRHPIHTFCPKAILLCTFMPTFIYVTYYFISQTIIAKQTWDACLKNQTHPSPTPPPQDDDGDKCLVNQCPGPCEAYGLNIIADCACGAFIICCGLYTHSFLFKKQTTKEADTDETPTTAKTALLTTV